MVMRRTLMTLAVDARAAWFRYKACFFTFVVCACAGAYKG